MTASLFSFFFFFWINTYHFDYAQCDVVFFENLFNLGYFSQNNKFIIADEIFSTSKSSKYFFVFLVFVNVDELQLHLNINYY